MALLNFISGPRNLSTAIMYSFAQRPDTQVVDEPFYALYLTRTNAPHPGREEVLRHQLADERAVKKQIAGLRNKPVVFIKNMAHHMEVLEEPLMKGAVNVLLIRNPAQILASYAQVMETPAMRDIGIEYQYHLFGKLMEDNGNPIVVDAGTLLKNPRAVLETLCHRCAIAFFPSMLSWRPGPKPYDGIWARYWYKNVHQSAGFAEQKTSHRALPAHLHELLARANDYYEKLLPFSIKA